MWWGDVDFLNCFIFLLNVFLLSFLICLIIFLWVWLFSERVLWDGVILSEFIGNLM